MKLTDIDRWVTQVTEVLTNASGKLDQVADLDLGLGKKLDKLTNFSTRTEQKLNSVGTKLETLADLSVRTEQQIERVVDKLVRRGDGSA